MSQLFVPGLPLYCPECLVQCQIIIGGGGNWHDADAGAITVVHPAHIKFTGDTNPECSRCGESIRGVNSGASYIQIKPTKCDGCGVIYGNNSYIFLPCQLRVEFRHPPLRSKYSDPSPCDYKTILPLAHFTIFL